MTGAPAHAASCYEKFNYYTTSGASNYWPSGTLWAYTTSYCVDINVKPNTTIYVQTCFNNGTFWCNDMRRIAAGTWGAAATNVNDNTRFYLRFQTPSSGLVAF